MNTSHDPDSITLNTAQTLYIFDLLNISTGLVKTLISRKLIENSEGLELLQKYTTTAAALQERLPQEYQEQQA